MRKFWPKLENGGFYIIEDLFIGKLPWNTVASKKQCLGFLHYKGHNTSPNEIFIPKFVQDIAFLNRTELDDDIIDILNTNNQLFYLNYYYSCINFLVLKPIFKKYY